MPERLKAMIVEDEYLVRADLVLLLQSHSSVSVETEAETVEEAKAALARERYDVAFLDVQLRSGSGFDIIDAVPKSTAVIFISSYPQYAVRAFEVDALDYLVKPVTPERLAVALNRLTSKKAHETSSGPSCVHEARQTTKNDIIVVQCDDGKRIVALDQIVAVISVGGNYTSVHVMGNRSYTVRKTFKEWETILPQTRFVRIHRQSVVNMGYASALRKGDNGIWELGLLNFSEPLSVSRRALPELKSFLKRKWTF